MYAAKLISKSSLILLMFLLLSSFSSPQVFDAVLSGFAAFASIVAFYSAYAAFLSAMIDNDAGSITNASAVGLAVGFPLGVVVAALNLYDLLTPIHVI